MTPGFLKVIYEALGLGSHRRTTPWTGIIREQQRESLSQRLVAHQKDKRNVTAGAGLLGLILHGEGVREWFRHKVDLGAFLLLFCLVSSGSVVIRAPCGY